jgi:cobalt-zinc-cadmium resistance protein CzcA
MQLQKLPSIALETSLELDTRIQQDILAKVPEVKAIVARTGADELGLDPMGLNETDTFMVLAPRDAWRVPDPAWLEDELRKVMSAYPGVGYSFTQPIDMRVSEMLTGVRGDLAVKIYGPDLNQLNQLAAQTEAAIKATPGAQDTFTIRNEGVQYLQIVVDRLAAGRFGLDVETVQDMLKSLLEGRVVGTVIENGRKTALLIRGDPGLRNSVADFSGVRVATPNGNVALSNLAKITRAEGPLKVDRENAARFVVVQSNVHGRDLVGFVEDAKAAVAAKVKLPAGYSITWGGQFENQQRAAARLALVVPLALALIFFLLFSTFRSVRQAVLVLSNIPFALVGGVFALLITGEYLSVPASVGFIALLGIAVLNGVVMITYFNQLHAKGMALDEVVVEGARRRLRPVLMTANIAAFGLAPLLFASGPGSEVQRPLAIVVIGGLMSSTMLTLLILPILYRRFGIDTAKSFREVSSND